MATRAEIDRLSTERRRVRTWVVEADGRVRQRLDRAGLEVAAAAAARGEATVWVDIDTAEPSATALLDEVFRFHPLAVEDAFSPDGRIKCEEYDGYLFLVARGIQFAAETPEPYDIEVANRWFFLAPGLLVSLHGTPSASIDAVARRIEIEPALLGRGADHVLYLILDQMVDRYFPVLDQVDEFVDELEANLFGTGEREELHGVFALRRTLIALRRHLAPQREVVATLINRPHPAVSEHTRVYLRDVHDHVIRQVELVEAFRDLLTTAMETHLTLVSNRLNEVIKILSIITTIVLPPTLVASIYGMNVARLPLADSPAGFWIILGVMAAVSAGFLLYLRRKRWI